MMRLLLIIVITTHSCRYSTGATNQRSVLNEVMTDLTNSICYLGFLQQAFLYLDFCKYDGFDICNERFYIADDFEVISLDCDTKCSNQTDVDVVWNIHLFSKNYNLTVSCRNDSCTSINEYTKLLNVEQDFTMENTTLEFYHDFIYQDTLVGCIATADNCTENRFWVIYNTGLTRSHDARIYNPLNETTYYAALGESLIVACEVYDSFHISVVWRRGHTSVKQSVQHCSDFDINNVSCISPSLPNYKKQRVRSRFLTSELCESYVILNSSLDIPIVDWTDNGSSYSCVSKKSSSDIIEAEVHVNILVDVIPEFLQLPPPYSEQNTSSSYSCVVKAGWDAKVQWFNASGYAIPEHHSANYTSPPSLYVTYSMNNVSTVFKANNFSYTGDSINTIYPVHNATLHYNDTSYHHQNSTFICIITGVNEGFLKQYNATDNLTYFMTVYANITLPLISSEGEFVVGIIMIVVSLILAIILFIIILLLYYGQRQRSRKKKLSNQAVTTNNLYV